VEIEHSPESLHAHVDLKGVDVGPGDSVVVHGAPIYVPFGERRTFDREATVVRATALGRLKARVEGYLELTELYEVGFSEGRAS
jgi:hypothetical protein